MSTYTFIMDFAGEIYVRQREAHNVGNALSRWLSRNPCPSRISHLAWTELKSDIENRSYPMRMSRVRNAWWVSGYSKARVLAFVTIIKTDIS
jgi:hypothetical protein